MVQEVRRRTELKVADHPLVQRPSEAFQEVQVVRPLAAFQEEPVVHPLEALVASQVEPAVHP